MNVASQLRTTLVREVQERFNIDLTSWLSYSEESKKALDLALVRVLDEYGLRDLRRLFPTLAQLVDRENGLLAVRTFLNYTTKVKIPSTKTQVYEACQGFEERNLLCRAWSRNHCNEIRSLSRLRRYRGPHGSEHVGYDQALLLVARELVHKRLRSYKEPGLPSHGPGATTNAGNVLIDKYAILDRDVGPALRRFSEFFSPSPAYYAEFRPLGEAPVSCKLSAVPKDFRGPRLIAPHSVQHMWMQQAVSDRVTSLLVRNRRFFRYNPLLNEQLSTIQFDDQLVNASLALYGSTSPCMYGTIDLSDASDRIPWLLVWGLTPRRLARDLAAVRARAYTHDGQVRRLYMHAPMGSACCFPILSVVAWAVCCAALWLDRMSFCEKQGDTGDLTYLLEMMRSRLDANLDYVWVFGDDIVIPPERLPIVRRGLAAVNLKVNDRKSFNGKGGFRESCGCDAYRGDEITPLRLRVDGVSSVADLLTLVEHSNALGDAGYVKTRKVCLDLIEICADKLGVRRLIAGVTDRCLTSCVVFETETEAKAWNRHGGVLTRYNRNLQRREVRALHYTVNNVRRVGDIDSRGRLFEGLLGKHREVSLGGHQPSGWTGNRPRLSVAWLPFW